MQNNRANIASSVNLDLISHKNWGSRNLVNFNGIKTQCCLISRRFGRNLPDISFDSSSLEFCDKISLLGSYLSCSSVAKAPACNLGYLFQTKLFFTPTQLLTRPKFARICGRGAPENSLATLDAIQRLRTNKRSSIN